MTKPYDNVLYIHGANYQNQRYTWGLEIICADIWSLDDPNNGWNPRENQSKTREKSERLYHLQDPLGSPIRLLNEEGKSEAQYNYNKFGVPQPWKKTDQNWPGPDNTFGFTGYQYDLVSGLSWKTGGWFRVMLDEAESI